MTTLESIFNPLERNAWIYADEVEDFIVHSFVICDYGNSRIFKIKVY